MGRGDLTGRSTDGTLAAYSSDVRTSHAEVELARSFETGNWNLMPAAWLRYQRASLDGTTYSLASGRSGSLDDHTSEATIFGLGIDMAYQGWKTDRGRVTPALRLSYETRLDDKTSEFTSPDLALSGLALGGGTYLGADDSFVVEPSIAFGTLATGQALLSGWYDSGSKTHGAELRWLYQF
jgi:hypothetical protein